MCKILKITCADAGGMLRAQNSSEFAINVSVLTNFTVLLLWLEPIFTFNFQLIPTNTEPGQSYALCESSLQWNDSGISPIDSHSQQPRTYQANCSGMRAGWEPALCNDSYRSVQQPVFKTAKMVPEMQLTQRVFTTKLTTVALWPSCSFSSWSGCHSVNFKCFVSSNAFFNL